MNVEFRTIPYPYPDHPQGEDAQSGTAHALLRGIRKQFTARALRQREEILRSVLSLLEPVLDHQETILYLACGSSKPTWVQSLLLNDNDGDGDTDVLHATSRDDVSWQPNLGGGNFGTPRVITGLAADPSSVYADDLDGDGDVDVVTTSRNDGKVALIERGACSFNEKATNALAAGATAAVASAGLTAGLIFSSSAIKSSSICRRPAVSSSSVSQPCWCAAV